MQRIAVSGVRLGQIIRETRQSKKFSLRHLSSVSGVPYRTIDRIERGEVARPRPDLLAALSQSLDIPLTDLYELANYDVPVELPPFAPYLRLRYRGLSAESIKELKDFLEKLASRDGVRLDGPPMLEDEDR